VHAHWRRDRLAKGIRDSGGGRYPDVHPPLPGSGRACALLKPHWLEWQGWADPVLQKQYETNGGSLRIPDVPGVGLDWNDEVVAANFNLPRSLSDRSVLELELEDAGAILDNVQGRSPHGHLGETFLSSQNSYTKGYIRCAETGKSDIMDKQKAYRWRLSKTTDLDEINKIADAIHTGLPERPEVFAEKRALFPEGCLVLGNGSAVGYGISHPWILNDVPSLDSFLERLPASPDCLYIHDVAILPAGRGHDAAGAYVKTIVELARKDRITSLALVSVYDTHPLWARHGFKIVSSPILADKLASYGQTAKYMVRSVSMPPAFPEFSKPF
jgi:hypothetical protein